MGMGRRRSRSVYKLRLWTKCVSHFLHSPSITLAGNCSQSARFAQSSTTNKWIRLNPYALMEEYVCMRRYVSHFTYNKLLKEYWSCYCALFRVGQKKVTKKTEVGVTFSSIINVLSKACDLLILNLLSSGHYNPIRRSQPPHHRQTVLRAWFHYCVVPRLHGAMASINLLLRPTLRWIVHTSPFWSGRIQIVEIATHLWASLSRQYASICELGSGTYNFLLFSNLFVFNLLSKSFHTHRTRKTLCSRADIFLVPTLNRCGSVWNAKKMVFKMEFNFLNSIFLLSKNNNFLGKWKWTDGERWIGYNKFQDHEDGRQFLKMF